MFSRWITKDIHFLLRGSKINKENNERDIIAIFRKNNNCPSHLTSDKNITHITNLDCIMLLNIGTHIVSGVHRGRW